MSTTLIHTLIEKKNIKFANCYILLVVIGLPQAGLVASSINITYIESVHTCITSYKTCAMYVIIIHTYIHRLLKFKLPCIMAVH